MAKRILPLLFFVLCFKGQIVIHQEVISKKKKNAKYLLDNTIFCNFAPFFDYIALVVRLNVLTSII